MESHYRFLKEAAEDARVEPLGYLPRDECLAVKSRHLGLHLPAENNPAIIETVSELIEKHVAVDRLLGLTEWERTAEPENHFHTKKQMTIALACDDAFNFTYAAQSRCAWTNGKSNPLQSAERRVGGLMLTCFGCRVAILNFFPSACRKYSHAESGKRFCGKTGNLLLPECGGMMYLGKRMVGENGMDEEMCGIFQFFHHISE